MPTVPPHTYVRLFGPVRACIAWTDREHGTPVEDVDTARNMLAAYTGRRAKRLTTSPATLVLATKCVRYRYMLEVFGTVLNERAAFERVMDLQLVLQPMVEGVVIVDCGSDADMSAVR